MARNSVRGTPYTHVKASNTEGQSAGTPGGYKGTVGNQYGDDDIQTGPSRGTPYNSHGGNGPESKRVVSHDKYGMVESNEQRNANDPKNNGSGVVLDGAHYANGFSPHAHPTMDSPIPTNAPRFDPGFISTEDAAHLGSGNESGREGLLAGGGVMSRGMVGTSKASDKSEMELTTDDTLPAVGPVGTA